MIEPNAQTVNIAVTTRTLSPTDDFFEAKTLQRLEDESLQAWREMSDDDHKALIVLLRDALGHCITDPEAWLPASIMANSDAIQVVLTIKRGDLHNEVTLMRQRAEDHMATLRDDLIVMRRELQPVEGEDGGE